ncbi:methyltransferase domain-containing protein [bacterium]|nr:methyltransferase domain-containing protein [bacterium]
MQNKNSTTRFSDRVNFYVKFRPDYPEEVLEFLKTELQLTKKSVVSDIGSGTGISSKMFLENGNTVFAVEPNKEMRTAAEILLAKFPNFKSINATAEETELPSKSIDFIVCGQAFHWFDVQKTKSEFSRILKNGGFAVLIWNERKTNSTPFLAAYEELLQKFATDYNQINHKNIDEKIFDDFFVSYELKTFENFQSFDYEGIKGRLLSSSYVPLKNKAMIEKLKEIFDIFKQNGKVIFEYDTKVFYGKV